MNAIFGDARDDTRKRPAPIIPACGSCSRRVKTYELPVSGLRRCWSCWEALRWGQGFCEWPRLLEPSAKRIAPQPELEGLRVTPGSQPTVVLPGFTSVEDYKLRQAGEVTP